MSVDPTSKVYFDTPMIRLSDMKYPVYLSDFLQEQTNVSIGSFVWEYDMRDNWGYCKVHDTPKPSGDVVVEGEPEHNEEDDLWYKTWISRDFTPEEVEENLNLAKQQLRSQAYQLYSAEILSGVVVDGDTFSVEPREFVNLQMTRAYAVANPESQINIRKADYTVIQLPSEQAVVKIDEVIVEAGRINQALLSYIKALYDTEVIGDLPEVPTTFKGE